MNRLTFSLSVLATLLLPACATTAGKEFSVANTQRVRSGVTHQATVLQLLGEPYGRSIAPDGKEIWSYTFTTSAPDTVESSDFPDFISFYKALFGTLRSSGETRQLAIEFQGELVSKCALRTMSDSREVTAGMLWGGRSINATTVPKNSAAVMTTCGDIPGAMANAPHSTAR